MNESLRGNTLDHVRQRNLALVLGRVHAVGGISRAQLTRETGLNRSTIGALVAELVVLGLVLERDPEQPGQVGRPSPVIVPSDTAVAITVHPELDAVVVGLVGLGGRVITSIRRDTDHVPSPAEVVAIVSDTLDGMRELDGRLVAGIGLAVPGLVRASDGVVRLAPHLDWHDEPLGELLHSATGHAVYAANDASLGAIAENVRGAGRGVGDLIYLNGGASGIGGGIMSSGRLLGGVSGYAGEIGHTLVNSAGTACHCGSSGCLETEVTRSDLLAALELSEPDRLESELVARVGEPAVAAVVQRQIGHLARAIANAVNVFNPELVVLGGFLGSLYAAVPHELESQVERFAMTGPREVVRLTRAALGPHILSVGAAELAFAALLADPASAKADQ